ncbi:ABC transporter substrate-binding protein [Primorskyibacter sp. 2E107]|uniref:ABC transporter substrate-binding protein n=1 Tax=Primorskyibacter sp. 2E107 TaxID=3403458 RepID=UPI003AF7D9DD
MALSDLIPLAAAALLAAALPARAAPPEAPQRIVSLNVCTDQMALLLADPGQIAALSPISTDPRSAVYAAQAEAFDQTEVTAESVVLRQPDLILAGRYTTRATVEMLTGLGYRVEIFEPSNSLATARENIAHMGRLLGPKAEARAAVLLQAFDARLAALRATPGPQPRVALYYALGNTAGTNTLGADLLAAAGLRNIAADMGLPYGGALPLEALMLADPDLILVGQPYSSPARATDLLTHPVLKRSGKLRTLANGANWLCATPALLDVVEDLVALRLEWSETQ